MTNNGWSHFTIGECCEIVSGSTPKSSVREYWGGQIHWATPRDLSNLRGAYIADTARKITEAGLRSCAATLLPAGSVLFSSRAPIGHVAVNLIPMATNQGFKSLIPKSDQVDAKYLYHWLRVSCQYLESLGNGATFKEVSKAVVSRVEIPLPPIPQQRRIAAILDRTDALRAKRRKALVQLYEINQSIFFELFGDSTINLHNWPLKPLRSLVRSGDSINYGVVQPGNNCDRGVPLIRVGNLIKGRVDKSLIKRIDPRVEKNYRRSRLRGDEVLVSCVGSIGEVALADDSLSQFNIARAVARIPLGETCDRTFVSEYLRTEFVQNYFRRELRTVSQPTLNIKQLAETLVLLPPLGLQREFANRVEVVEQLKTNQRGHLAELDALFASLAHRAFRGEL